MPAPDRRPAAPTDRVDTAALLDSAHVAGRDLAAPAALTVAGSDPSGGAGVQADLKTFAAFGVYGMAALTLATEGDTAGVRDVVVLDPAFVARQVRTACADIPPAAVKTGMLATAAVIEHVAAALREVGVGGATGRPLVVDPVMCTRKGDVLIAPDAEAALARALLPLALVATPNAPEAARLSGRPVRTAADLADAARAIHDLGVPHVLAKGGHLEEGGIARDCYYDGAVVTWLDAPRREGVAVHGAGCTLSAAVAAALALDDDVATAVARARRYVAGAILAAPRRGGGALPPEHAWEHRALRGTGARRGAPSAALPPGVPDDAFADPHGGNRDAVARVLHDAVDLVVAQLAGAAARPPMPAESALPRELWAPDALVPAASAPAGALLAELRTLLGGAMNPGHPGYVGHMDSVPTVMSLVAELAAAAANNNMSSVEMSPAFSHLEWRLAAELGARFGLGARAGGVMTGGGTLANVLALTVARNRAFAGQAIHAEGVAGLARRPVLLASELAHTSLQKAAMLLGLGTSAVVPVGTDARGRIDPDALERAIAAAERHGEAPFAVVATAGTTVTGSVDPLDAVADVARRNALWLHVDAAYGGALVFSPRERHRLAGVEHADSVTFNPQKWLYVAKTCAVALFRDVRALDDHVRVAAPYMRERDDGAGAVPNLGELGIQGTRHADVLKLWLTLKHLGTTGMAALVEHGHALTRAFVARVRARPYLALAPECAPEPEMNLVCFRGTPEWVPPAGWDAWNAELQDALVAGGQAFLSLPRFRGEAWLRAVLLNPAMTEATLDAMFAEIDRFAARSRGPAGGRTLAGGRTAAPVT